MSFDRPEAESFKVRFLKTQTQAFTPGVNVWWSWWALFQVNKNSTLGQHFYITEVSTPCKSNLFKFLVGLLLDWNFSIESCDIDVTEEQAKYLEIIFKNQKSYSFWKKGLEILKTQGKEKAWEWIQEEIPILKLSNKLEGRE